MNSTHTSHINLPDSFFDLNTNDLKLLLRELRAQASGSSEEPLMTSEMRQLEDSKEQINKLNRFKATIIRVQFPDRNVLQGIFAPTDTVESVHDFVRPYLDNPDEDFVLCKSTLTVSISTILTFICCSHYTTENYSVPRTKTFRDWLCSFGCDALRGELQW